MVPHWRSYIPNPHTHPDCAKGYAVVPGDIGGQGWACGEGGAQKVSSCEACGQKCDRCGECGSYECSPTELTCNLNKESKPTTGTYKDFDFCVKGVEVVVLS